MSRRYLKSKPPKIVPLGHSRSQEELITLFGSLQESLTHIGVNIDNRAHIPPDEFAKLSYMIYQLLMSKITDFRRKISRPVPDGDIFKDVLLLCIQLALWTKQQEAKGVSVNIEAEIDGTIQRSREVTDLLIQKVTLLLQSLRFNFRPEFLDGFDLGISLLMLMLRQQCQIDTESSKCCLIMQRMQVSQVDKVCVLIPYPSDFDWSNRGSYSSADVDAWWLNYLQVISKQMDGVVLKLLQDLSVIRARLTDTNQTGTIEGSSWLKSVMSAFLISSLTMAVPEEQRDPNPRILRYVYGTYRGSDGTFVLRDTSTIMREIGFDNMTCNVQALYDLDQNLNFVNAAILNRLEGDIGKQSPAKVRERMIHIADIPDVDIFPYSQCWLVAMMINNIIRLGSGRTLPYTSESLQLITTEITTLCSTIKGYRNPYLIFLLYVGLSPKYFFKILDGSEEGGPLDASEVTRRIRNGDFNVQNTVMGVRLPDGSINYMGLNTFPQFRVELKENIDIIFNKEFDNSLPSLEYFMAAVRSSISRAPKSRMEAVSSSDYCDIYKIKCQIVDTPLLEESNVTQFGLDDIMKANVTVDSERSFRILGSRTHCGGPSQTTPFVALRETFSSAMESHLAIMLDKAHRMEVMANVKGKSWPDYWPKSFQELGSTVNPFAIIIRPSKSGDRNGVEACMMLLQHQAQFAERMGGDSSTEALYSSLYPKGYGDHSNNSNIPNEARLLFTAMMTVLQHTGVLATISECQERTLVTAVGDSYFNRRGRDGLVHQDSSGDGEAFSVCTSLDMTEFEPGQIRSSGEVILGLSGFSDPTSGILHPSTAKTVITNLQEAQLGVAAQILKERANHPVTVSVESMGPGITSIGFIDRVLQHSSPLNFSRFLPTALFEAIIALLFNGPNRDIWTGSECAPFISKFNALSTDLIPYSGTPAEGRQAALNMELLIQEVVINRSELQSPTIKGISILDFVNTIIVEIMNRSTPGVRDQKNIVDQIGLLLDMYNCDGGSTIHTLLSDTDSASIESYMRNMFTSWQSMNSVPRCQAGVIIYFILGYRNIFPIGNSIYSPPSI